MTPQSAPLIGASTQMEKRARTGNYGAVSMLFYVRSIVVEGKEQGERNSNKADCWPSRGIEGEII